MTVAVGMSGGVDSAVAAHLLLREGYRVVGLTMQVWDGSLAMSVPARSACYGPGEAEDIAAARAQASRLGIPHHVIPLAREYSAAVLDYFRREYRSGRTPNPCVTCNHAVKFGFLLERAAAMGIAFDRFATGHYAGVRRDERTGRMLLLRGVDRGKDQSYFLSRLSQSQLARVMFPLGALTKQAVKNLARNQGWADLANKQESQNFIEAKDYGVLFGDEDSRPGPIVDRSGKVLGEHRGIIHYTVGQRRGVGLGGTGEPLYVIRIDACANTLVVGTHDELFSRGLRAAGLNWIGVESAPLEPLRVQAKIRQQHTAADAVVAAEGQKGATVAVTFDEPQMSVTPGQTVVFYIEEVVVGSGVILSPAA
jgi:tRNA-specific 2-thiouridylase